MKARHSARVARWLSLISVFLVFLALAISKVDKSEGKLISNSFARPDFPPTCPPPFKPQAGICVLHQSQTIITTIEPISNTTLDCQNNVLSAATSGSGIDGWPGSRSNPEVAIFLNGVQNVVIQNCTIQGFDFGIIAINSKRQVLLQSAKKRARVRAKTNPFMPNKILKNIITARFTPISLMAVDGTEIKNNTLTYLTIGGRGVYVARNSDANIIQTNRINADFSSGKKGALMVPGPLMPAPTSSLSSNPQSDAAPALVVTHMLGPEPTLLNAIIGGTLYQLGRPPAAFSGDISGGNVIDDNEINYPGPPPGASPVPTPTSGNDGIVTSVTAESVVSNNKIWNAAAGIRAGIQIGAGGVKQFPGKCSLDATRLCLQDSDCAIPGFDPQGQSKGTGTLPAPENVFWLASENTIENNEIRGPFGAGIVVAGQSIVIQGNTIDGNLPQAWKGVGISLLGKYALETTTITANKILKVDIGISLQKTFELSAKSFSAKVFRNTITDYNIPVQTNGRPSNRYDLKSELSVNGEGGYWGPGPCAPGLDPNKVKDITAPPNSLNCDPMTGCSVPDTNCLSTAPVRVQPPSSRQRAATASSRKRQQNKIVPWKKKLRKG